MRKRAVYIDANTIITAATLFGAVTAIAGVAFNVYRWYLKQNKQDEEIEKMKNEQCLLTYGILACLKGLSEQGCNGPVTEAINKIEKHINKQAHNQED
jgi:Na+/H+ antiporter NhaD/arsenite permease-like protein